MQFSDLWCVGERRLAQRERHHHILPDSSLAMDKDFATKGTPITLRTQPAGEGRLPDGRGILRQLYPAAVIGWST